MRRSLLAVGLTAALLGPAGGLEPLRAFLASLWSAVPLAEGCGMDPSGLCRSPRPATADAGCGMDPDGRCHPPQPVTADAGCGFDPNGRCSPAP